MEIEHVQAPVSFYRYEDIVHPLWQFLLGHQCQVPAATHMSPEVYRSASRPFGDNRLTVMQVMTRERTHGQEFAATGNDWLREARSLIQQMIRNENG